MVAAAGTHDLSLAAFLAWEGRQDLRHERLGGVVRAMAGGTIRHDRLAFALRTALERPARARGCQHLGSDVKVTTPTGDVLDPDVTVRCGPRDGRATTVEDPLLVAEVLSESTAQRDLTQKRQACKAIPSLRVILYLAQEQPRIDIVRRGPDGRRDDGEPAVGLDSALDLPELGLALPLAELYADTDVAERGGAPTSEEP